ncbi:MAG: hypothetical protein WAV54_00795 [Acidimicrobiales bacterium]
MTQVVSARGTWFSRPRMVFAGGLLKSDPPVLWATLHYPGHEIVDAKFSVPRFVGDPAGTPCNVDGCPLCWPQVAQDVGRHHELACIVLLELGGVQDDLA